MSIFNKKKSIAVNKMSRVGIFIESPRFLQHSLYLSKGTSIKIVTTSNSVYEALHLETDSLYFLSKEKLTDLMSIKKKIRRLSLDHIILFSDSTPISYWIQRNFITTMIFDDSIFSRDAFYYKMLFMAFSGNCNFMENLLGRFFGPNAEIDGTSYKAILCKTGSLIHFIKDRLFFGYKEIFVDLPGRYSTHIAVGNKNIRDLYLRVGVSPETISISGSLEYDIVRSNIQLVKDSGSRSKRPEVVFFTQPFNKYSWGEKFWQQEVKSFVDDCKKNGVSFVLSLHPRDDISFYEKYVDGNCILDSDASYEEKVLLVKSSKLVVVKSSSIINVPLALRKPIAYINYASFFPHSNMLNLFRKEMIIYKNNNIVDVLQYVDKDCENIANLQEDIFLRLLPEVGHVKSNILNIVQV